MALIPSLIRRRLERFPNLLKILYNIGWLFLHNALRMGVGLLLGVWMARHLGPEQFGLFSFVGALIGLFGALAGMGMQGVVVRDIVQTPERCEDTLGTAMALQFIAGTLAYGCLLAMVAKLRPNSHLTLALAAILGSTMLLRPSEVAAHWFESQVQSKYPVLVQNFVFMLFACAKALLIRNSAPTIAFAWVMFGEAATVAVALILALDHLGPRFRSLKITGARMLDMLNASWPLMLSNIAVMVYMKIDQIMIAQMLGDEAAGIYSSAVKISELPYFIATAVAASVLPTILESKKCNPQRYQKTIQATFDLMVWLSIIVVLPLTLFSTSFVFIIFGSAYRAAGNILAVHVWATIFVFLGVASGNWFLAENQQIKSLQRALLAAAVNILLNLAFIPKLGLTGAAWATLFSYAVAGLLIDAIQTETRHMFIMKIRALDLLQSFNRLKNYNHDS